MTKARTSGAKRRAKSARIALAGVCSISGVAIGVEANAAVARSQADTGDDMTKALSRQCARLGIADTPENRARVKNVEKLATLYGSLAFLDRISADAYAGHAEAHDLDGRYLRQVQGAGIPGRSLGRGDEPETSDIERLKGDHAAMERLIKSWTPALRSLVDYSWYASPDTRPAVVSVSQARLLGIAGHAFARHFGLRP